MSNKGVPQVIGGAGKENREVSERGSVGLDYFSVRQCQDQWIAGAKHLLQTLLQTRRQPALTKIIVDHEIAAGLKVTAHVFVCLAREQKTLEANIAVAAV